MSTFIAVGEEPALDEVMSDPIIVMLMQRDGVRSEEITPLLDSAREYSRKHLKLYKSSLED